MQVTLALSLAELVVAESVEYIWFGCEVWVVLNSVDSHANISIFGQHGSVGERIALKHDFVHREQSRRIEPLGFFHERIQLSQFRERILLPCHPWTILSNNLSDFFSYVFDVLRSSHLVVYHVDGVHLRGVNGSKGHDKLQVSE